MPTIVTAITGFMKTLPSFTSLSDSSRTPAVRLLAAVIALVAVLIGEWVTGFFDASAITVVVQTVFLTAATWVGSLGIFHGLFQKPQ